MQERNDHSSGGLIRGVYPAAGIEGGEVIVTCSEYDTTVYDNCRVNFGEDAGRMISASPTRVIASIPETAIGVESRQLHLSDRRQQSTIAFVTGKKLAEHLHPVANPVIDREDGSIFTTLSGTRGQKVPVSIYRITTDGTLTPFLSEIVNPTGLAFSRQGDLLVTSRYEGSLYRISAFREPQTIATDLGVATGIAVAPSGDMFVGDRNGTIHRVNELGESRPFANIEPSVAAFHLAFGPGGDLYATGPTV
ncbi:MAG: gluconolaconase, partial [Acidobacteria bacterium]|nr:gluconolaconase [Acidobacteriota bacterium]